MLFLYKKVDFGFFRIFYFDFDVTPPRRSWFSFSEFCINTCSLMDKKPAPCGNGR